jgi:hypothetical protein
MKPVPTKDATHKFAKPANWDDEANGKCGDLSVRVQKFGATELIECVSTWAPTEAELILLLRGGVVVLSIVGTQPPVAVTAEDCPHMVFDDSTAPLPDEDSLGREPEAGNDGG